jgi:hypothetical protein
MRWAIIAIKSLGIGVLAIALALVTLLVSAQLYGKYVLHLGPNEALGWDPGALFGPHWKAALLSVPALIFLIGFGAAFWFFSRSLQ